MIALMSSLGYTLEIIGLIITLSNAPKQVYGMYMRNSNDPTPSEVKKERNIKLGYGLIIGGTIIQMISGFFN